MTVFTEIEFWLLVVFLSEISLALYLLPAMFGGIGINVISHILVRHLSEAEDEYRQERRGAK